MQSNPSEIGQNTGEIVLESGGIFNSKVILAIIALIAVMLVPHTSPGVAQAAGDVANPIVQLLQSFMNHLVVWQDEVLRQLDVGWISMLTVLVLGATKSLPWFRRFHPKTLRTVFVVAFSLISVVAYKIGFGPQLDNLMPFVNSLLEQMINPVTVASAGVTVGLGEIGSEWLYQFFNQRNVKFAYSRGDSTKSQALEMPKSQPERIVEQDTFNDYP